MLEAQLLSRGGDHHCPGQEASNAGTLGLAGIRKGRAVLCASGLTQASPPLRLEGHLQLTETSDHKSQRLRRVRSQPPEPSFLLGEGLGHVVL